MAKEKIVISEKGVQPFYEQGGAVCKFANSKKGCESLIINMVEITSLQLKDSQTCYWISSYLPKEVGLYRKYDVTAEDCL